MKKLALVAVACAALATPALASDHTNVTVVLKNTAIVSQGGNGHGQAAVAMIAQGAIATIQAPHDLPTVIINTGFIPVGTDP
jgi:opacity protein-like surface antigen